MQPSRTDRESQGPPLAGDVLDRLARVLEVAGDRELSRALGQSPSAAGNWRSRGSVPYSHCVSVALERGVSLDWLLTGRERAPQTREIAPLRYASLAPPVAPPDAPREPPRDDDPRLAAVIAWWRDWWARAPEEDRTWALVQLRRAIPESAEAVRQAIDEGASAERTSRSEPPPPGDVDAYF